MDNDLIHALLSRCLGCKRIAGALQILFSVAGLQIEGDCQGAKVLGNADSAGKLPAKYTVVHLHRACRVYPV